MRIKYGLLGERLSHSYSKIIHNRLGNSGYELFSVDKTNLEKILTAREFAGLNITIPYKKHAVAFCDRLSDTAKAVGSVNTLVFENGELVGHNTDYAGFSYMARRAGISFERMRVLILGSGGTSLTARAVASDEGAKEITVISRSGEANYGNIHRHFDCDILVNTTPVGMYPDNGRSLVNLDNFTNLRGVIDVIYNPLRTALLFDALERGIPCTNGLSMLVSQAGFAHELFFNTRVDDKTVQNVLSSVERDMSNIVLIGMPGCGKSTIGKIAARKLKRRFIDTDALIEKKTGKFIPDIFSEDGEEAFRRIESEVICEIGKLSGAVIATGGGAVTWEENYRHLKQNGTVFFIERELCLLESEGRPLSKSGDLREMYARRLPLYERFADIKIQNNASPEAAADKIISYFA
jgi:shikimate dehydrogenase